VAGGALAMVGWLINAPTLTDWDGDGIAMFANAALMAICAGGALILLTLGTAWSAKVTRLLAVAVTGIAGATLFEHLTGIDLGIDDLLVSHTWGNLAAVSPGRPGPPSSVSFVLLATALILGTLGSRSRRLASLLAVLVSAGMLFTLTGYAFQADRLYGIAKFTGIAMQTATMILGLAIGILAAIPEEQPTRTLCGKGSAGVLARRALPALVAIPIILGWVLLQGQESGIYDARLGCALLVTVLILVLCGLLWWCMGALRQRDETVRVHQASLLEEIAERELAERQMLEAKQRAEEASRAKDNFLAALSHELRTPLTPALMTASHMATDATLSAEVRGAFEMIRRNVGLEARLIDDLLDLTRISRGKVSLELARCDAHELLKQCTEIVAGDLEDRGLALDWDLSAREYHVRADATRFHQVMWNLLKNAIKFSDEHGGPISIRTCNPMPQRLAIAVEDRGCGIHAEALERIFQPFEQVKRHSSGGLGLGLSISKAIVDLHGGQLRVASEGPGCGATFTVELPMEG
jgi:signal transduction histidine kinase